MGRSSILGLLGICRKAGKIKLGFDPAADTLGKDGCLLIFSSDVSLKTRERMLKKAEAFKIASLDIDETSDDIWYAIGKRVAVMSVTDKGLAENIVRLDRARRTTENHDEEDTDL